MKTLKKVLSEYLAKKLVDELSANDGEPDVLNDSNSQNIFLEDVTGGRYFIAYLEDIHDLPEGHPFFELNLYEVSGKTYVIQPLFLDINPSCQMKDEKFKSFSKYDLIRTEIILEFLKTLPKELQEEIEKIHKRKLDKAMDSLWNTHDTKSN